MTPSSKRPKKTSMHHLAGILSVAVPILVASPSRADVPFKLQPQLLSAEAYGETFSLVADLGEQGYVQAQIAFSNLGPGDHHGACRFMVIEGENKPWSAAKRFDRDEWRVEKDALKVGPCRLESGDTLQLTAPLDDGKIVLTLHAPAKAVAPPEHRIDLEDNFYEVEVLVPWAPATLSMHRKGAKSKTLTGFGYADHSRSTALPSRIARLWVRFRAMNPEQAQLLLLRFPEGKKPPKGWFWSTGTPNPSPIKQARIQRAREKRGGGKQNSRPWRAMVQTSNGAVQLRSQKLLKRHAPIEEYGFLGRIASAVIGNPVTYTFRGQIRMKGQPPVSGIMEVTVTDE
ncbi:MAG: hypothetical protein AAF449_00145 [Myxococcota bacterium]